MRVLGIALLIGSLTVTAGCTAKKKQPGPVPPLGGSGVVLKVDAAKSEFRTGEPVVLRVELASTEKSECLVLRVPDGGLAVVGAVRDGDVLLPGFSTGDYIDGMSSYMRHNLVSLKPKASLRYEVDSEPTGVIGGGSALRMSSLDSTDGADLVFWPVDEPGRYELDLRYAPPPLDGPLCRASGDPVHVTFAVRGG